MMRISKSEVAFARGSSVWDLGNSVLYDLCRKYPSHKNDDEIIAKIWLIGRSYAAPIERRRNAEQNSDDFYESTVAPALRETPIDNWLAAISKDESPGSPRTIAVHKELMDRFAKLTKLKKRSLASKYLHFHRPNAFFIYDSRARAAITRVVPRLNQNQLADIPADKYDQEYKDFVRRCVWLRETIRSAFRVALTPREIDKLLLAVPSRVYRVGPS